MAIKRGVQNLVHYAGDAYTIQFTILDINEDTDVITPIDITNLDLLMQIRVSSSGTLIYQPEFTKTDPVNGIFIWKITPEVSEQLNKNGVYDIQLSTQAVDPQDVQTITFLTGSFSVVSDVSRPEVVQSMVVQTQSMPTVNDAIAKVRNNEAINAS